MKQIILTLLLSLCCSIVFGQEMQWYPYQKANKKWCFVSIRNGSVLNNREFDSITSFRVEGIAKIQQKGNWGVMDTTGRIVVPMEYKRIEYSDEAKNLYNWNYSGWAQTLLLLEKEGVENTGVSNFKGEFINPFNYDLVESFHQNSFYGYEGYQYDFTPIVSPFGLYKCSIGNTYEVVNAHGKVVLDSTAIHFARPTVGNLHYFINYDTIVATVDYSKELSDDVDWRIWANRESDFLGKSPDGKRYYAITMRTGVVIIDVDGKAVSRDEHLQNLSYRSVVYLVDKNRDSTMYFIAMKDSLYGMIDERGNHAIEFEYDQLSCSGNSIFGRKNNQDYCFNDQFDTVPCVKWLYSDAFGISNENYIEVGGNKLHGVVDVQKSVVVPAIWNDVEMTHFRSVTNFIGMSKKQYNRKRTFRFRKRMVLYSPSGEILAKRRNVNVEFSGYNLVYLEHQHSIELLGSDGESIVKSRKPKGYNSEEIEPYFHVDLFYLDPHNFDYEYVFLFHSRKGWLALDTTGKIRFRSHLKNYDYASALVHKDSGTFGVYAASEYRKMEAIETTYGLITVPMKHLYYDNRDNRIYGLSPSDDSILVVSLSNQVLKKFKKPASETVNTVQYYLFLEETGLDSLYALSEDSLVTFTDYNFNPFPHPPVNSYKTVTHNLIGNYRSSYFLMLKNGKWVEEPRFYDTVREWSSVLLVCFRGDTVDIYNSQGELLYDSCTNLKWYSGCMNFTCNGKNTWMTFNGVKYQIKE